MDDYPRTGLAERRAPQIVAEGRRGRFHGAQHGRIKIENFCRLNARGCRHRLDRLKRATTAHMMFFNNLLGEFGWIPLWLQDCTRRNVYNLD